jgi:hypothetical protein
VLKVDVIFRSVFFALKEKKSIKKGRMNCSVRVHEVLDCKCKERNLTLSLALKTENFAVDLYVILCSSCQKGLPSRHKLNYKYVRLCSLPVQYFVSNNTIAVLHFFKLTTWSRVLGQFHPPPILTTCLLKIYLNFILSSSYVSRNWAYFKRIPQQNSILIPYLP